jgi:hypothetical protein
MARPTTKKKPQTAVTCLFRSDVVAEVREIAARRELSQADILRELVKKGLERERRSTPPEAS